MPAHFGLDIGSSSIKVLELKNNKEVDALGIAVNPVASSNVDLAPERKNILVEAVKSLINQSKVKSKKVVLSIPETLVFSRIMSLPVMSSPEMASAIKWELDQVVPFPPDEVETSWVVFDKPKKRIGNEMMKVFVVAVPKKVAESYVNFLALTGLEPERIENEILSLVRAVVDRGADNSVSLVMDIGASATKIVVAKKGWLYVNHVIPLGGMAMTRMISETFKISMKQAEEYKRVYGIDETQVEGKIYKSLSGLIDNMLLEIRKVMANFSNLEKDVKIERIVLVGGGAYLKGFTSFLVEKTGLNVALGNSLSSMKIPEKIGGSEVVFTSALGLAISE